jgi:hypothetical protein
MLPDTFTTLTISTGSSPQGGGIVPSHPTASGMPGQINVDNNFVYVYTNNIWKKSTTFNLVTLITNKSVNKVITQEINLLGYYIYININKVIFIQYAYRNWNSL